VNSASQCIGKHYSQGNENFREASCCGGIFLTFLKFFLKFKEHIPFRETALNTLREI
jgi:hypothetical protein